MPLRLECTYLALYTISVMAGLWQKGQPTLTLCILLALFPVALVARLPRRFVPAWFWQVLQGLIGVGAAAWGYYRFPVVALDLVLVESTALFGFALIIAGLQHEYGLLAMIAFILVGYGGITPSRSVYLPALILYGVFAMLILYQTRTSWLSGDPRQPWITKRRNRADWLHPALHFLGFVTFCAVIMTFCPLPQGRSVGVVPVSFETTQEQEFPMLWRNWVGAAYGSAPAQDAALTTNDGNMPSMLSRDADKVLDADYGEKEFDAREGLGSGAAMGQDLVFRVRAPAKLYWLGQLYDKYDGKVWQTSPLLKREQGPLDRPLFPYAPSWQRIPQAFSIEKALSRRLFGAFRAYQYSWGVGIPDPRLAGSAPPPGQRFWTCHTYGATIIGPKPELPWRYTCQSSVPSVYPNAVWQPSAGAKGGAGAPGTRRLPELRDSDKAPFLTLPKGVISERVQNLARDITAKTPTPLQKALALRDWLRANCKYNLNTPPVPPHAEVVDWFLFESKEGYCQHFAQALTVMSRAVGLPARLATGFSPGNYNVLTGCFEVYEYHGHAWTQIFVEHCGWLTFDGVPPGQLQLQTTPSLVGSFMDPFGDEWSAFPPELAIPRAQSPAAAAAAAAAQQQAQTPQQQSAVSAAYDKVYRRASAEAPTVAPTPAALSRAAAAEAKDWLKGKIQRVRTALTQWLKAFSGRLSDTARRMREYLRNLGPGVWATVAALVALAVGLFLKRHAIRRRLTEWRCRRRCAKFWAALEQGAEPDPGRVVAQCYALTCELLRQARHERPASQDLLEYAQTCGARDPALAADLSLIAGVFARYLYSGAPIGRSESEKTLLAVTNLRDHVLAGLRVAG